ncbi:MAG: hypothetical protein Q9195_001134 [Heterodermia aff. obscurata]
MALGKRKRRDQIGLSSSSADTSTDENTADLHARFRHHFEAKFKPLEGISLSIKDVEAKLPESTDLESDWEGLSDSEDKGGPQIVHHQNRPASTSKAKIIEQQDPEEMASDAANLKKDLALQRLLKESHLLESRSALSVSGRNRHKAVDMRLQDLGSKTSLYAQPKMPLSHRRGIAAKSTEKEEARRREAQENGIILEKAAKAKKGNEARRQRSIGAPTVGRFQGGMLKLSKRDVANIQGPTKTVKRKR